MNYKNLNIERALTEMGFESFTEIQSKTIPLIESGLDVIGHSQTGTGKTAAFGIPLLDRIDESISTIQAVVICPTRELAVQVKTEIDTMGKYIPYLKTISIYGGEPIQYQIRELKKNPQIIIGTPGRIIDLMRRKLIKLHETRYMVLDEADEMLKMGFVEDIETILDQTNPDRQTVMFSATMPPRIVNITKKYMKSPELVSVITSEETNKDITQYYYMVHHKNKIEAVSRLLHIYNPQLTLIFCNTKKRVDEVTKKLELKGYSVNKIHGDLKQTNRLQVLDSFHEGLLDILVATDVAARGLDIKNVEVVINYDVPEKEEYYVHRIGRTGRIGNQGYSFTLVSKKEMPRIDDIVAFTKTKIRKRNIPESNTVLRVKQENEVNDILEVIESNDLSQYKDTATTLLENANAIDIISALLLKTDKNQDDDVIHGDINEDYLSQKGSSGDKERYHINVGKDSGLTAKQLVKYIMIKTKLSNSEIQDVVISKNSSFFSTPKKNHHKILSSLTNVTLSGKAISVRVAKPIRRRKR